MDDLTTRTEGGTTIHYYYNHAIGLKPIVAERNEGSGQFLRYYAWTPGGELLYMIDATNGNKVHFHHFDRTGSTLALTDGSGAVTDSYAYTPYGRLLGHTGSNPQPFTFNGQWGVRQEGNSGDLYQMRARYYDATVARFISRDPMWPNIRNVLQANPYQFAQANPLQWIDVTGLLDVVISDGEGGWIGAISGTYYDDYFAGISAEMAYANSIEPNTQEAELFQLFMRLDLFQNLTVVIDEAGVISFGGLSGDQSIWFDTLVQDFQCIEDIIAAYNLNPGQSLTPEEWQYVIENIGQAPEFWNDRPPEDDEEQIGIDEEWAKIWQKLLSH